jgi:hypothetical protein
VRVTHFLTLILLCRVSFSVCLGVPIQTHQWKEENILF